MTNSGHFRKVMYQWEGVQMNATEVTGGLREHDPWMGPGSRAGASWTVAYCLLEKVSKKSKVLYALGLSTDIISLKRSVLAKELRAKH